MIQAVKIFVLSGLSIVNIYHSGDNSVDEVPEYNSSIPGAPPSYAAATDPSQQIFYSNGGQIPNASTVHVGYQYNVPGLTNASISREMTPVELDICHSDRPYSAITLPTNGSEQRPSSAPPAYDTIAYVGYGQRPLPPIGTTEKIV